ncbi:MAG: hypothetical protein HY905_06490 [Deltaproteobacteria bacterium]|nr:hypothetical protein [Deltaproteobacteria bacterium]
MRVLMKVSIPVEAGNKALNDGSLSGTIAGFVEEVRPEASYFVTEGAAGRTAYFVFDMKDSSYMPWIGERFFTNLNASIEFKPAMNLEDLKTGLGRIKKG